MKKTVIKRRKRVVAPANGFGPNPASTQRMATHPSQSPQQQHQHHHHHAISAPQADTEMADVGGLQTYVQQVPQQQQQQQQHRHFPPPVDFTTPSRPTAANSPSVQS